MTSQFWSRRVCVSHLLVWTGAGDETRTRDINLGKVALYQLSYTRVEDAQTITARRESSMRDFARVRLTICPDR
jgi:hypothetical protein